MIVSAGWRCGAHGPILPAESVRQSPVTAARAANHGRKVRAPQDKAPGNPWEARAYGKCSREQTAQGVSFGIRTARVKGCGKSAPRAW